jgi:hypothetical protein
MAFRRYPHGKCTSSSFIPSGSAKKDGVVRRPVLRVFRRRVEDGDPLAHEELVDAIDVFSRRRAEREMMEAGPPAAVNRGAVVGRRGVIPMLTCAFAQFTSSSSPFPRDAAEAERGEDLVVERGGARHVANQIEVVDAENLNHRRLVLPRGPEP